MDWGTEGFFRFLGLGAGGRCEEVYGGGIGGRDRVEG